LRVSTLPPEWRVRDARLRALGAAPDASERPIATRADASSRLALGARQSSRDGMDESGTRRVSSRRLAACLGALITSPSLLKIDPSRAAIADASARYETAEDSTDLAPLPRVLRRWGDKAADRRAKRMQRYET
jgi:hypothetical protein